MNTVNKDNYAVIMAGGIGSRFWPMSRTANPKQFHDILGVGKTLIQMTFQRLQMLVPIENIYIVTNARYKTLVLEQLPEIKESQVLCEPFMRNTAPCIAYANFIIAKRNPNARIIVAPSDHLITGEENFRQTLTIALEETSQSKNLLTIGIQPTRPDTGYGYIQFEEDPETNEARIKTVHTFTEKPNLELAQTFLDSGDFLWNSGIFIWSLENIQRAYRNHLPDMYALFESVYDDLGTEREESAIEKVYEDSENISIDYGIMEKVDEVKVVTSDFGWSDLGTWGSLYTLVEHDKQHNAVLGKHIVARHSSGNMVYAPDDKLVVLQGLHDFIVVDTPDALMICKKDDEQKIKTIVNELKISKADHYV